MAVRAKMAIDDLPRELLDEIIVLIRAPAYKYPGLVSRHWHERCSKLNLRPTPMLAVTSPTDVTLLDINGSVIDKWSAMPGRMNTRSGAGRSWATGIACGEDLSLHVSQYCAHGLLTFAPPPADSDASWHPRAGAVSAGIPELAYVRTSPTLPAPEGVVCAHGCVYSVGINPHRSSSLIRHTPAGTSRSLRLVEKFAVQRTVATTLWGISMMPENEGLFIAAHDDDDQEVEDPTIEDSGRILAVRFSWDEENRGSFNPRLLTGPVITPRTVRDMDADHRMPPLNRPNDLVCCRHGYLFVTSFRGHASGRERVIYKLAVRNIERCETIGGEVCCITLPAGYMACGLTCTRGDVLYATAHDGEIGSSNSAIFSFHCGCSDVGEHAEVPHPMKLTKVSGAHGITSVP